MAKLGNKAVFLKDPQKSYPVAVRGEGVYIYDREGKKYLDAMGGVIVVNIGHGVGEIAEAMKIQASKLAFAYTGQFLNESQMGLADRVLSLTPQNINMVSVYFTTGGSEGTEVAIKMARQYHLRRGEDRRYKVIGLWQSFHGASMGALSVTGHTWRRLDYIPYLAPMPHIPHPFCYRCSYGQTYGSCNIECAQALENLIRREGPATIAAFIAEPITGSSANAVSPPAEFLPLVREICNRYGVLMIMDEVITGFGRTGVPFGVMHSGVKPDLIICGKGISSGYAPLGAVIVGEQVNDVLVSAGPFFTGYTYSGHPVSCAAGIAVLDYMERHNLLDRAKELGTYFQTRLQELNKMELVGEVRGRGLLAGIEFVADKEKKTPFLRTQRVQEQVASLAFNRGVIISAGSGGIATGLSGDDIAVAPPFVIERHEIDLLISVLSDCILSVSRELGLH